jgi:N-acetylglucosamine kinase
MMNRKIGKKTKNGFVIGVDGGGTKTACALADLGGKIVARSAAGGSSVRNAGAKLAMENVAQGIYDLIKRRKNAKIAAVFIGLPAMEEEYKNEKIAIINELKKHKKIARIFGGKIFIGSDQLVAFRAGSYAMDGIVAICGTGSATHGWNGKKEFLANNKGWLASKGSGTWIGMQMVQATVASLEGRGPATIFAEMVFAKFKLKTIGDFLKFIYQDPTVNLARLEPVCDHAANRGDKIAREILASAGKEIAGSVAAAAKKLDFAEQVPLVFAGSVYKSRWVADAAVNEIQRFHANKFDFVFIDDPVIGAVKLALENIK